jgi:hypothetical protein
MTNFVLMGDVHSVHSKFNLALNYIKENIEDYHLIMLGDVFDSRCSESNSVAIYREIRNNENVTVIHSNHQWKLQQHLKGNNVIIDEALQRTLDDFANSDVDDSELYEWLENLPFSVSFRDKDGLEYRCAHAYHSSKLYVQRNYDGIHCVHDVSRVMRDKLIYGGKDRDGNRLQWWKNSSDNDWIRCSGHYHKLEISYENKSIVLDSGCGENDGLLSIFDVNSRSLHQF